MSAPVYLLTSQVAVIDPATGTFPDIYMPAAMSTALTSAQAAASAAGASAAASAASALTATGGPSAQASAAAAAASLAAAQTAASSAAASAAAAQAVAVSGGGVTTAQLNTAIAGLAPVARSGLYSDMTGTQPAPTLVSLGLGNVNNTSDANKPISTATAASISSINTYAATLSGRIDALTTALTGKVDVSQVGVSVAPLDGAFKLPLVNLTPLVSLLIGNGSATIPIRPATPNPVIFDVTGSVVPATGTTAGGSAAGVNGLDRQWT